MRVEADALRWLEDLGGGRCLYEVARGEHVGTLVVGYRDLRSGRARPPGPRPPGPPGPRPVRYCDLPTYEQREARRRADELLESMLDDRQRDERLRSGGLFWVETSLGWIRFGRMYDLRLRPAAQPNTERAMCVVPAGWDEYRHPTPAGDFWVNVLLMALHQPGEFRRVAVVHRDVARFPATRRPCDSCGAAAPFVARGDRWLCPACGLHRSGRACST